MSSLTTSRIKSIIAAIITTACLGTAAVPFMTSAAAAPAASAAHTTATPNVGSPWPGP